MLRIFRSRLDAEPPAHFPLRQQQDWAADSLVGLCRGVTSHHRCDFRWVDGESVDQLQRADLTEFFNGIGHKQLCPTPIAPNHAVIRERQIKAAIGPLFARAVCSGLGSPLPKVGLPRENWVGGDDG